MKITASNIQFKTEYSQRQLEKQQTFQSQQIQREPETTNSETPLRGTFTATNINRNYALNSSAHSNTYSTSEVKNRRDEASRQITTGKAVSSLLSRFYSERIELSQTRLSGPDKFLDKQRPSMAESQFTLSTSKYYEYSHEQSLSFVAEGEIQTENGETIQFKFYANNQQSFQYQSGSGAYAAQVTRKTDPLVINLQGDFNHLSNAAFQFDINNDGEKENLSFAGTGSGFLVLDRNNDGVINNGSELFGPTTGNGFTELAELDEDGNGFIDEGDSGFHKLQVWLKDDAGNDRLINLAEARVAAISVESGLSPFQINDNYNNTLGTARRTGIFIYESGQVGSIQQVDLHDRALENEKGLKDQFDLGEQQQAQSDTAIDRLIDVPPNSTFQGPVNDIDSAMQKLDDFMQALLDRQEQLLELEEENDAKSLIAMIVDKLEEYRKQQEADKA